MLQGLNDRCQYEYVSCSYASLPTHCLLNTHIHWCTNPSNTVLKQLLHTVASCLTSLAVITTGPFSTNWHAQSLVTCHTPGCPKPDRAITLPHTDRWAVEWSGSCQRRRVALSDPLLCPIAWCDASTSANWPRAAGSPILPPVKGQRITMQNIQTERWQHTGSSHQKTKTTGNYITIKPTE